jgi:hypothetical protein
VICPSGGSASCPRRLWRTDFLRFDLELTRLGRLALRKFADSDVGRVMQEYETTLTSHGALSLLTVERYFSDAAAIHAAKKLRKNNQEKVEVWRGDVCVYAETPRKNIMSACP